MTENSLIQFVDLNSETIPNLSAGRFKLQINGKLKIQVGGELLEFDGDQSEIEIIQPNNKTEMSKVRLVRGVANIKRAKGGPLALNRNSAFSFKPEPKKNTTDLVANPTSEAETAATKNEIASSLLEDREIASVSDLPQFMPYLLHHVYKQSSVKKWQLREPIAQPSADGNVSNIIGRWLEVPAATLRLPRELTLRNDQADLRLIIESTLDRFAIEISDRIEFPGHSTYVFLTSSKNFRAQFTAQPGVYYLRTRSINEKDHVSAHSPVERFLVLAPPLLKPEPLRQQEPVVIPKVAKQIENVDRTPASEPPAENILQTGLKLVQNLFRNEEYQSSKLSLEGSAFTMYSPDQASQGISVPIATLIGLRVHHWWERWGVEGLFKTLFSANNQTARESAKPTQWEGKIKSRWSLPLQPFTDTGDMELHLLLGAEIYQNKSSPYFSSGYELLKAGFGLNFPLGTRWDTGGEVLLGRGADKSSKNEISGYFNYYWTRQWSLGAGYRLHLFTAGSEKSASPAGLPYREGFGEAYSQLRWHY